MLRDVPIRQKVMTVNLLTCVVVMLLMGGAFFAYEFVTFRQATLRRLATLGEITASNTTASLAFENQPDADEILGALKTEPHIVAAGLYNQKGALFSKYPEAISAAALPGIPGAQGFRFEGSQLIGFQPVVQGKKTLGTLYLRFDARPLIVDWLKVSLKIGTGLMLVLLLVAYGLSEVLQRQISRPIMSLAETARAISERGDFSVRARKIGQDELGLLTDAFNQMLTRIQGQNQALQTGAERVRLLNDELERRVTERTAQLQAVNNELEAFSYSVSHDLRAPLRHVDGFAGLLMKHAATTLDEKGRRYVATISDSARRMGRLIDDLLVFSRMSRSAMNIVEVDQDAMVAAVVRDVHPEKSDRAIAWDIAALPRVKGDPPMLRQVWFNLIDNAVKYSSKADHPRVTIGTAPSSVPAEQVFFVRDNGVGFDMAYVDKLFGVFQRLHGPAEFEGTGIGLANVRRIVTRHGGHTWAQAKVGEGATFYFSLPAPTAASPV